MGNHRADARRSGRAAVHGNPRHRRRRRASGVPTLVGGLVVAVAALGAIAGSDEAAAGSEGSTSASSHLPASTRGTDATGVVEGSRTLATSRDSERQALADAAHTRLQQPTHEQGRQSSGALRALSRAAEKRAGEIAAVSYHLPTSGYQLTARFGQSGGLWSSNHTGLDFAAPTGTPIFAVAAGVITDAGWDGSYGYRTIERLPDGTELWYAHQSAIGVRPGQQVATGQTIGAIGATGNVTGPHVHLEVRPGGGDPVDPYAWLVFHGLKP